MLFDWTDRNLSLPDGAWRNGIEEEWQGITVFTATSIGEALAHHGDILPPQVREAWRVRLGLAAEWLYRTVDIDYSNINYAIGNAYAMALLGRLFEENRYSEKGRNLAHAALEYFTPRERLLAGEGGKPSAQSPKGCYPVDLAYNVEESLPALVLFGLLEGDETVLEAVVASLRTHAEFLLPDGGWDDSWGTRNYKWTWWGGRTTMGCQAAYALLADRDPLFLQVAHRNALLLRRCTKDGILYGGPHNIARGVSSSLHHTTTHAKCLATVLDVGIPPIEDLAGGPLPSEAGNRVREFSDVGTWLITHGPWRATVTAYDWPFNKWSHPTGGALSLLWHREIGLTAVASMTIFKMVERWDMQDEHGPGFGTLTPRIEYAPRPSWLRDLWSRLRGHKSAHGRYMNIFDNNAHVEVRRQGDELKVSVKGSLVDHMRTDPRPGKVKCELEYIFREDEFTVRTHVKGSMERNQVKLVFPVVSKPGERIEKSGDGTVHLHKERGVLQVRSWPKPAAEVFGERIFSYVPGVACTPFTFGFADRAEVTLRVHRG